MMYRQALIAVSAATLLAACGGGGTVAVDLTDAPPDLSKIAHVYVTLSSVEVHAVSPDDKGQGDPKDSSIDHDNKWQTITARAGQFDLLALRNDVTASLGELDLPEGKITQIRLHVDPSGKNEVWLVAGNQVCQLDTKNVDQTGVKISHPFKALDIPSGQTLRLLVDFDVNESVSELGACNFTLNPVIKLKSTSVE